MQNYPSPYPLPPCDEKSLLADPPFGIIWEQPVSCLQWRLSTLIVFILYGQYTLGPQIFTELAPLGRFSHRVAMSRCVSVCMFAPLGAVFFQGLSLALRFYGLFYTALSGHCASKPLQIPIEGAA